VSLPGFRRTPRARPEGGGVTGFRVEVPVEAVEEIAVRAAEIVLERLGSVPAVSP
jgi:hypothetical protein